MQNVVGSGIDFGYTETVKASTNKLGSTMVIRGRQANQEQGNSGSSETYGVAVPKYIVSGSLAGASRTVANTCRQSQLQILSDVYGRRLNKAKGEQKCGKTDLKN